MISGLLRWLDQRLGAARFLQLQLRKVFPSHWSFLLGEIALYSFVVLVLTGIYLTFFYEPSSQDTIYAGAYEPLRGVPVSRAYASVLALSFEVPAGLLIRQIHHWASLLFIGAIVLHLGRVFFTGAFRKPREINWVVGVTMLVLSVVNGFLGYSLVDDLLATAGIAIANAGLLSIPVVGTWLASAFLGGEFPTENTIPRFYGMHILLVPSVLGLLIAAHLGIVWRQKHTQRRIPRATESTIVGYRLWPTYAARSVALFFFVFAILAALGGLVQINPVWIHGPFEPAAVTNPVHPDWYMGWVEGANRLFPPISIELFGYFIPQIFFPSVLLPVLTILALYLWPFVEAKVTGDDDIHHILDRPRDRPVRTAIGVTAVAFYLLLFLAASDDVIAIATGIPIRPIVRAFQVAVLLLPLVAGTFTYALLSTRQGEGDRTP